MIHPSIRLALGALFAAAALVSAPSAHAQLVGGDLDLDLDQDRSVNFLAGDVVLRGRVGGNVSGMAGDVLLDANISGDVSLAAGDITVGGRIGGDMSLAGANINITADVAGDIDAAGADVRLAGRTSGDVSAAGALITVDQSGMIAGDAELAGRDIRILGQIVGDTQARARSILIDGQIAGALDLYGQTVEFGPGARVNGAIRVRGPNAPVVSDDAIITGEIRYEETAYTQERGRGLGPATFNLRNVGPPAWAWGGAFSTTAFVLGVLACLVAPRSTAGIARQFRARPWGAGLLGLVALPSVLILVLTLAVMLGVTLIGIPLAVVVVMAYPIVMFLAYAFGALALGDLLFNRSGTGLSPGMRILSLLVVMLVIAALGAFPPVLWLLALITLCIGLGSWTLAIFSRDPRPAAPAAPNAPSAASEAV